jgi:hypothetical protein
MISFPTKSVVLTETLGFYFFNWCRHDEFFYFLGKSSPNFPCHKIEKKNHDAGSGHYVVDGH